jgi:hypothetical protein
MMTGNYYFLKTMAVIERDAKGKLAVSYVHCILWQVKMGGGTQENRAY